MTASSDDRRRAMVAEGRTYIGTPWVHQGRLKGLGVDCIGLALACADASGLLTQEMKDELPFNYHRVSMDGVFLRTMREHMEPVSPELIKVGDFPLMCWGTLPIHVGMLTDYGGHGGSGEPFGLLHAVIQLNQVTEQIWEPRSVVVRGYYRMKGLD